MGCLPNFVRSKWSVLIILCVPSHVADYINQTCTDQDSAAGALWQLLGVPNANCNATRNMLGCTDSAFAAVCPTTCGVCLDGKRFPGTVRSVVLTESVASYSAMHRMISDSATDATHTELDFKYSQDVIRQEIRLALYTCATTRRDAGYSCGSQRAGCTLQQ